MQMFIYLIARESAKWVKIEIYSKRAVGAVQNIRVGTSREQFVEIIH